MSSLVWIFGKYALLNFLTDGGSRNCENVILKIILNRMLDITDTDSVDVIFFANVTAKAGVIRNK